MSASTVSSFIIFFGTGLYEFIVYFHDIEGTILKDIPDALTQIMIRLSIYANAIWFYYAGAFVESKDVVADLKDSDVSVLEWYIRIFNQCWMLLIFIFFHLPSVAFAFYLVILYSTYIWWDYTIGRHINSIRFFCVFDFLGFIASMIILVIVLFLVTGKTTPSNISSAIGYVNAIYLFIGVGGVVWGAYFSKYKFKPWSSENLPHSKSSKKKI